jgi:hypothetical protein
MKFGFLEGLGEHGIIYIDGRRTRGLDPRRACGCRGEGARMQVQLIKNCRMMTTRIWARREVSPSSKDGTAWDLEDARVTMIV